MFSSIQPHTSPSNSLIVIIGATGTGKSNLAVSIASSLNPRAEIINADAMQLYSGLPIITNKITIEEQDGIPHHLLGTIGLEEEPWTVARFVKECDKVITEIRARGRIPVVVGGTGYYVHGLLMGDATLHEQRDEKDIDHTDENTRAVVSVSPNDEPTDLQKRWPILDASTEKIYAKLQEVDPTMAQRWHPNDRRKISRSLEIYLKTGQKASDIYAEQEQHKRLKRSNGHSEPQEPSDISGSRPQLRYSPLIFWLEAEDVVLKDRLNKRVDAMVQNGLIDEAKQLATFEYDLESKYKTIDKSKGIWASIGYKELEPWLNHIRESHGAETTKQAIALRESCVEAVRAGTRRYAKRQNRYIRIRLSNALATAGASNNLFLIDGTDLQRWRETVTTPAQSIINSFLRGETLPVPSELSDLARRTFEEMAVQDNDDGMDRVARRCEECDKVLMTRKEWEGHLKSRSHRKVLEGIRRRAGKEMRLEKEKEKDHVDEQLA